MRFASILPHKAAQAAFREAAKAFHPDHGGDNTKMQELNSLWDEVEPFYKSSTKNRQDLATFAPND